MSDNYRSRTERNHVKNQEKKTHKEEKPKKKGSFFKKFLIGCLLLGIVGLVAGVSAFFVMVKDAPKLDKSKLVNPLSTKFLDKNGNFFYEYGAEKRTHVTYDQIPKVVENAFLATEDSRFYDHNGIDFKRTTKAVMENVTGGFGSQGGSTITQQVVKNYFLTMDKTAKRKVQEWYLSYKLEQQYSKHEILEMYLNKINLGNRSYGIATAAQKYYGKDLKDLQLHEAAMLAGLPQGPNIYDPTKKENVERATNRRNVVLSLMNRHGYITKEEMNNAVKIPVTEGLQPSSEVTEMKYQAFLDAVVKEVEKEYPDVNIGSDGLTIHTTLDQDAQDYADKIMDGNLIKYPDDQFQGSFVFMDTQSGEVRAIGAGRKESKSTFKGHNMATDLKRQVGSTMKPIFDYGPAIENLQWSTYHQLNDSEYTYSNGKKIQNATKSYKGDVSLREALKKSLNIPALKTAQTVGLNKSKEFAEGLGMTFKEGKVYESTAIGSNEGSPLEVAGAYATFGNSGNYNKPHFVKEVTFPDGKKKSFKPKEQRAMQDYTAYMVTDVLRDVVKPGSGGTGPTAYVSGVDVAGKTGTQNFDASVLQKYDIPADANRDSWFAGYTPQYTMAVWTGYEKDGPKNYVSDRSTRIAQQMFQIMMSKFATDKSRFERPSSVQEINGELYVKGAKKDAIKQIKVDAPSGLNVTFDGASTVTLNWSGPAEVDAYAASYKATDGSSGSLSISGTTATLGGIKPGVTYSFSVVAKKGTGTSPAVGASFTAPGGTPDAKKAEEEAKKKADEEAKKKADEEAKKKANEDKVKQDEAKKKAEEEAKKQQEQQQQQEQQRKQQEEAQKKADEEARRKAEDEAKKKAEDEAKKKAEEEAKKKAEDEAKKQQEQQHQNPGGDTPHADGTVVTTES
ncbi:PBP1A family penicillin-binding protein [Bacillus thuringiensis]|uniref:Penicillin-binding protein n=1 Tax=Bacillus thuringiensis serovar toumanoffi TaxID=180862 RepID=A0ABD5HX61_BACTU|nr:MULTISPECIES: PBP1A family penicillin-binding protein [Bacillus]EEM97131.1 Penicillin-binding protein, 1A [Bacillus thuringiensis IBL 200]MBK5496468.1 PBP1A family penicillin-binding protein [Bacillus sp. TH13]MCC6078834.1 PBP1A family penicillin-binding protein [Bacillus thuringiensis]MCR6779530.1 PBP1A family penicillin-binding protein [Bacillus thuringiensis]MCR6857598.1 PBP1A family penicillin-binding protein [Bacillus thuringiensis]